MKRKITQTEIKANLELLSDTTLKQQEEAFNIIILNSPNGQIKIKTKLTLKEWLIANNIKGKNQCRKK
jgi:hypothetical protein